MQSPPRVTEVMTPAPFLEDEDLQERVVNNKMLHDYTVVLLICTMLLIITVLL
jgi:hypothetical protein